MNQVIQNSPPKEIRSLSKKQNQPLQESRMLLGKYEIIKVFERGQNGKIYKVKDVSGKCYAIREVKDENYPFLKQQKRECDLSQQLKHEGVPTYCDPIFVNNCTYAVRNWIEGKTLSEINTLGPDESNAIMSQLFDIVKYLHNQGVVLRDLKASNIILTEENKVKLLELGGAIRQGERDELTDLSTFGVTGTFGSTASEVFHGAITPLSDIYSLGFLLARLCLGRDLEYDNEKRRYPFEQIPYETQRAVIEKAMQLNPEDRYHSVEEMKKALLEVISDLPKLWESNNQTSELNNIISEGRYCLIEFMQQREIPVPDDGECSENLDLIRFQLKRSKLLKQDTILLLKEKLTDEDPEIRKKAASLLGEIVLDEKVFDDKNFRKKALMALISSNSKESIELLHKLGFSTEKIMGMKHALNLRDPYFKITKKEAKSYLKYGTIAGFLSAGLPLITSLPEIREVMLFSVLAGPLAGMALLTMKRLCKLALESLVTTTKQTDAMLLLPGRALNEVDEFQRLLDGRQRHALPAHE
jgi:serine/threonine protein kinase